jgi:hypothetical protein
MRLFVAAVVPGVLLGTSACGPLSQVKPDPLKFRSARHFLHTDRVKMKLDLDREIVEARAGPDGPNRVPPCYNLTQNVNIEVKKMDRFAVRTVTDDVRGMQKDVATLRTQRADFKRDINDFVNDGVARPNGEPGTIEAITDKIQGAVKKADATIMHIEADLHQAHFSAARLATGRCAGDAPHQAPTIPLVH